jgi:pseudouridine-5'-phosphate glycosidase
VENWLSIRADVAAALAGGRPVVALESTVIAHGLPKPHNVSTARQMEAAVRQAGAVPATIGILEGKLVVGLNSAQIVLLAESNEVAKVSRADLAPVLASGKPGATTVATTMFAAALAGIRVFATGGIGGVHRGGESSLDISADLTELSRTPVAVVCAGAKAILDLPRTLEVLETLGVPVVGFGTSEFPAFYSRESGLRLLHRVETAEEAARLLTIQWELGKATPNRETGGILFVNPPPAESALARAEVEEYLAKALASAEAAGIRGKAVTPYLLQEVARASGGRSLRANMDLLVANARLAGQIAAAERKKTD